MKTFFDYPLDVKSIISKSKIIKKDLLSTEDSFLEKKNSHFGWQHHK
jgi:hypothetical protein